MGAALGVAVAVLSAVALAVVLGPGSAEEEATAKCASGLRRWRA